MCGLAGFVGLGSQDDLRAMTDAIRHRGPDGAGYHIEEGLPVFLGHRRLAVVDVASGHQPMWNETHDICVLFNGEIYNHEALRAELIALGHRFATDHSDTEVLVHGWEAWGSELPSRLNGMFAFVIFDRQRKQLFMARDRFGEKPLYYGVGRSLFTFASELTALTAHGGMACELNVTALGKLFGYGYIPAPNALYKGTYKLPGGHFLSYDLQSREMETGAFWTFALQPDDSLTDADEPRLVDELQHLVVQAASRRLMSDVPLGVFLSGGVDSSLILAALAVRHPEKNFETFTIGFNEPSFDESPFARTVANHIGSNHHERLLDLATARDLIPDVLKHLDEPFGDPSILPTSLLCAFAHEKVTVSLSGDGGDELFAGYDPFIALGPAATYDTMMPAWGHRNLRRLVDFMPKSGGNMSLDFKLRRTLMGLSYPDTMRMPIWMSPLEPADLADLLETPVRADDVYREAIDLWETGSGRDPVDKSLEFFTRFYLQDDILAKTDRAAMMHSLETRAVFLDNDLVDFCQRLPNRFKLRGRERKYLLKKVARRMLPTAIVDRKKKGFGIPVAQWLKKVPREPPLSAVPGVDLDFARNAWDAHRAGTKDLRLFLWTWMSLQASLAGSGQATS